MAELLARQVARLQVRAVELVEAGAPDRVLDVLKQGLVLVAALLNEAPTDLSLRVQLGFLYKAMAQVFDAMGDSREALVGALLTVRRAMVSSSAALILAFLALALSGFSWNRELGLLGGYLLMLALGSDLLFGAAALALVAHRHDRRRRPAPPSDRRSVPTAGTRGRRGHMRAQLPTSCQRPIGDIGSRARHTTRTRPLLAWWFVRWPVRDAEVGSSNLPHPTPKAQVRCHSSALASTACNLSFQPTWLRVAAREGPQAVQRAVAVRFGVAP